MAEPPDPGSERSAFLPVLLAIPVLFFGTAFLIVITGGLFLHVLALAGFIGGVGAIHYFLWGKLLVDRTLPEREDEEREERKRYGD